MQTAIEKWLKRFRSENQTIENEYTPSIKIQSTVDEGKGMKTIERMQHVWYETKKI